MYLCLQFWVFILFIQIIHNYCHFVNYIGYSRDSMRIINNLVRIINNLVRVINNLWPDYLLFCGRIIFYYHSDAAAAAPTHCYCRCPRQTIMAINWLYPWIHQAIYISLWIHQQQHHHANTPLHHYTICHWLALSVDSAPNNLSLWIHQQRQ